MPDQNQLREKSHRFFNKAEKHFYQDMDILELIKPYTEYIKVMYYWRLLGFFSCIQIVLHFQV